MWENAKRRRYLYLTVCTGNLLVFSAGMSMGWSSPVLPKLLNETYIKQNPFNATITDEQASWIGSLLPLGGILGCIAAGYSTVNIGRKGSILACSGLSFITAFAMLTYTHNVLLFLAARFIAGFGVGSIYIIISLYNGEVAEVSIRGYICSSITTFEAMGELFSYCAGSYLTIFWFCNVCFCLTLLFTLLVFIVIPESPYYLISVNDKVKAEKALMKLRSGTNEEVQAELQFIQSMAEQSREDYKTSILDIFRSKTLRRAQIISMGIMVFQNFSGIMPILFYAQNIFLETGSRIPSDICNIILGTVQCASSFVTPFLVDRLGRRYMLVVSASGMMAAEVILGGYFFLKHAGRDVSSFYWLPVTCLVAYMISYILGFGPLPWTILGEIFPSNVKAIAATISVCTCWSMGFVVSKCFYTVADSVGIFAAFWMFAGSCALAIVFILTYVIETKNKDFQEIQQLLSR